MEYNTETFRSVHVTLISRSDCSSCCELLKELGPVRQRSNIAFQVVDVPHEAPPAYAQAFIFPATYVNGKLWRYGKYPLHELEERLQRTQNETLDE
ncbi:hypothetical protein ACFL32_00235 [Candidatus Neomarinimicrobiota bacterium]